VHSTWRTLLIVALATIATFATFGASSALAANEIAYRCGPDVCLLDPNNPSAVTNLTDNGETSYDEKPIWSPDGTKVAFVSDFTKSGHGEKNVFVMTAVGTGDEINLATQITPYSSGGKAIDDLAWSPDGSRIAYTRGNNAGDDKVWVVNADGTTTFPLEIGGGGAKRHPSWSPDSSKIAYAVVKNEPQQIYLAPSTGGFGQPLTSGVGHEPNWSPDGSKIAFDGYHSSNFGPVDLHIVDADGGGTPLIVTPSSNTQWTFNAWSPDSGRIAYRSEAPSGTAIYRVMNANGSGDHPLASPGEGDAREASWSPDGSRIVYEGALIGDISARNLYIANADGSGGAQPLTSDGKSFDPAWRVVTAAPPGQVPGPGQHAQLPPPHPGAEKPKVVWISKRIPWTPGPDLTLIVLSVGCGGPVCNAGGQGTSRGSVAAGIRPRPGLVTASVSAKGKAKPKKPRKVVVGKVVKTTIRRGQTRPVKMKLTAAGVKLLTQLGKLAIDIELTIATPGQPTVVEHHKVNVFVKEAGKKKHKH
jgi:TolB protein